MPLRWFVYYVVVKARVFRRRIAAAAVPSLDNSARGSALELYSRLINTFKVLSMRSRMNSASAGDVLTSEHANASERTQASASEGSRDGASANELCASDREPSKQTRANKFSRMESNERNSSEFRRRNANEQTRTHRAACGAPACARQASLAGAQARAKEREGVAKARGPRQQTRANKFSRMEVSRVEFARIPSGIRPNSDEGMRTNKHKRIARLRCACVRAPSEYRRVLLARGRFVGHGNIAARGCARRWRAPPEGARARRLVIGRKARKNRATRR